MLLAGLYKERTRGDAGDNIDLAITDYERAASLLAGDPALLQLGLLTQLFLANSYHDRINGSKSDNIEASIKAYQTVVAATDPRNSKDTWVAAQAGLAGAYRDRIAGSKSDNLEPLIEIDEALLGVLTLEEKDWVYAHHDLGW